MAALNSWPVGIGCIIASLACSDQFARGTWSAGGLWQNLRVVLGLAGTAFFIFAAVGILSGEWS